MVNNAISFLLAGKSSKRAFRGVRRKTLPAFFSLTGFRVVTRPTACEPLRDHSPTTCGSGHEAQSVGKLILVIGREKNAGRKKFKR
jgi:hypothetical protein